MAPPLIGCLRIARRSGRGRGRQDRPPPQRGARTDFPVSYGPFDQVCEFRCVPVLTGCRFPRKRGKEGRKVLSRSGVDGPISGFCAPAWFPLSLSLTRHSTRAHQADGAYPLPAGTFPRVIAMTTVSLSGVVCRTLGSPTWSLFAQVGWRCLNCEGTDCGGMFFSPLAACRLTRVPALGCAGC